jgi:hypothetical protein
MITTKDGKLLTTEQLAAAGLSVNDKGEIVDASGKVGRSGPRWWSPATARS